MQDGLDIQIAEMHDKFCSYLRVSTKEFEVMLSLSRDRLEKLVRRRAVRVRSSNLNSLSSVLVLSIPKFLFTILH